jgi:membrane associated rhomboid family serine protease
MVRNFQSTINKHGAPISALVVIAVAIVFLVSWATRSDAIAKALMYVTFEGLQRPWTAVTYPFAYSPDGGQILWLIFSLLMMWWFGGDVERMLGRARYAIFLLAMTVLPALFLTLGAAVFNTLVPLAGLGLPLAAIVVAWATINSTATVRYMAVLPVPGWVIGVLTAALVFFPYGPLLGWFAALHLLVAFLYARNKIPGYSWGAAPVRAAKRQQWKQSERDDRYLNDVKQREIDRQERERLKKLFEGSIKDEPEDRR